MKICCTGHAEFRSRRLKCYSADTNETAPSTSYLSYPLLLVNRFFLAKFSVATYDICISGLSPMKLLLVSVGLSTQPECPSR
ncbi:hypothetical protein F2Q68_00031114 [Brassica cretica]|uniref:Uncharacterized protein n=1 Tax=Brassica cretica TaxID=69181 RepID=A0A8S9G535_BRACR|nr:hypothetical protein F2Q68_00031114 [Brassica cretica]